MLPFPIDVIGSESDFVDWVLAKQKNNGAFFPSEFCTFDRQNLNSLTARNIDPKTLDTIELSVELTQGILSILTDTCQETRHLWQDCHDKATRYVTTLSKLKDYPDIWCAKL